MESDVSQEGGSKERTLPLTPAALPFSPGQILGERYRVSGLLGRGGMGEVWRAYDLKLRVDVALKTLLPRTPADATALELVRREVRLAREVMSPNVCRIFDLVELDGREMVSMEYIDGQTLTALLRDRSPLDLPEALRLASQFLAGLEAIHQAHLVHRDLKPENIMITRAGRVVLMDFGVAKGAAEGHRGTIAGTPAYMAPEQLAGEAVDARADIFAAGIVLAEMIAPGGLREADSRQRVWEGIRRTPVLVPEGPWRQVLARAVSSEPSRRFESAGALSRALEEVTFRVAGGEDRRPYPGLRSFTANDAEFFFGREVEVEGVWKKLTQTNLLAVIGPSGAGKTSFVQAGLLPASPSTWRHVICRPGAAPHRALATALVPELAGDVEATADLVQFEVPDRALAAVSRWRARHDRALVVVDQFEELFTLCPPETQASFAEFLGRMALETDVHVLLVMRDDFLIHCHDHPRLSPIFSELTPLRPPSGASLRQAVVQPALLCGYRFEDETLADAMLAELAGERGALPMLAFAAAQLWERRDRDRGMLTRAAYEEMGGVAGALARHAESILEQIGTERQGIVREIFRNLVTSQGTRSMQEVDELLSVFEDRGTANEILARLVEARLLTTFEVESQEGKPRRFVEIVHESLLTSWPRLVRWRTQDADGAQLRDQLRQAAALWADRHRSEDLLWTGTAYREFELWRERYPGGLTETETAFAEAMQSRALRRRRRRRIAIVASFTIMVVVLGVFAALWRRSETMTRVGEARNLHMQAEDVLPEDNTLALALATASLEREENPAVRRLALEALWREPVRFVLATEDTLYGWRPAVLSPDGQWLATQHADGALLWPRDGNSPRAVHPESPRADYVTGEFQFHPGGQYLLANRYPLDPEDRESPRRWTVWSMPDGRELQTWELRTPGFPYTYLRGEPPQLLVAERDDRTLPCRWWRFSLNRAVPEDLGRADTSTEDLREFEVDPTGRYLLDSKGNGIYLFPLDSLETALPILVGRHEHEVNGVGVSEDGTRIASADKNGGIRVWSRRPGGTFALEMRHQTTEKIIRHVGFNRSTSLVEYWARGTYLCALLDRDRPTADPALCLPSPRPDWPGYGSYPPDDSWIALPRSSLRKTGEVSFYPLARIRPQVMHVLPPKDSTTDDGFYMSRFVSGGSGLIAWKKMELWQAEVFGADRSAGVLWRQPEQRYISNFVTDPTGRYALANGMVGGRAWLIPLDGSEPRALGGFQGSVGAVALSPDARQAAVGAYEVFMAVTPEDQGVIRVWNLETGDVRILRSGGKRGYYGLWFLPGNRLLSSSKEGLFEWDLATGEHEVLKTGEYIGGDLDASGRYFVVDTPAGAAFWDLEARTERILPIPSDILANLAVSGNGSFVAAGTMTGEVLYLRLDEAEPHLLLGHSGQISGLWIPPECDRIYSAGADGTVRIWPVPEGRPLMSRPLPELLDVLHAQTNQRVVVDAKAPEGYRIVYDRFPGWEKTPGW